MNKSPSQTGSNSAGLHYAFYLSSYFDKIYKKYKETTLENDLNFILIAPYLFVYFHALLIIVFYKELQLSYEKEPFLFYSNKPETKQPCRFHI